MSLASVDSVLVSAGEDGTLKVWRDKSGQNLAVKAEQQGQFNLSAPITCTDIITARDGRKKLICGDILGNVAVLNWIE